MTIRVSQDFLLQVKRLRTKPACFSWWVAVPLRSLGYLQLQRKLLVVACCGDVVECWRFCSIGEFGADVVVGSMQRFGSRAASLGDHDKCMQMHVAALVRGVPMWFGGPSAAYLATSKKQAAPGNGQIQPSQRLCLSACFVASRGEPLPGQANARSDHWGAARLVNIVPRCPQCHVQ